jgi:hypothetical protein
MEHACVPGSSTTPGRPSARVGALGHIAFRYTDSVGTRNHFSIAAQWLACTFPCRRFAGILANACARLGADVVRYSFIVVDLHHLLLAGLPAHLCEKSEVQFGFRISVSISSDLKTNSASNCRREKTTKKMILRFFCRCDFSHSLGP